jgi:hypothetical protein
LLFVGSEIWDRWDRSRMEKIPIEMDRSWLSYRLGLLGRQMAHSASNKLAISMGLLTMAIEHNRLSEEQRRALSESLEAISGLRDEIATIHEEIRLITIQIAPDQEPPPSLDKITPSREE